MMRETAQPILRRAGIIGDVHGEDRALYAALDYLLHTDPLDALVCTGDLMDKRSMGDAGRCCSLLQMAGVLAVRGEFDHRYHEDASVRAAIHRNESHHGDASEFIECLPTRREFDTVSGRLMLCHSLNEGRQTEAHTIDETIALAAALEQHGAEEFRYVIVGHSHQPMVRTVDGTTIINAGSLFWEDRPCFAIADFEAGFIQFYEVAPFTNQITVGQLFHLPRAKVPA
jgi:predicted phosphodiesterase